MLIEQTSSEPDLTSVVINMVVGVPGCAAHIWMKRKRLAAAEVYDHEQLVDGVVVDNRGDGDGGSHLVVQHPTPRGEHETFTSPWITRSKPVGTCVPVAVDSSGSGRVVLDRVAPWRVWAFPVVMWSTWFGLGAWRLVTML